MYRKLANVLRAFHIILVATIFLGFISAFFFPQMWIRICTTSAVLLEIVGLLANKGECPLTVWEYNLRKKENPNLVFKKLIPEILKHFVPERHIQLAYSIYVSIGALMGIGILLQLLTKII